MSTTVSLKDLKPAELAGRDTISRFQAQFRAAAFACLSILDRQSVDRIYCDYHDDFVSREPTASGHKYNFYQVKTRLKQNHQWNRTEVFGLVKRGKKHDPAKYADSFAGKLVLHAVRFKANCGSVVFLTNVQFDNEIQQVADDLKVGSLEHAVIKTVSSLFPDAYSSHAPFTQQSIDASILKLSLQPGISYLNPKDADFHAIARSEIYKYSEVDLEHTESKEIVKSLEALVQKKSFSTPLITLDESAFDESVGIGLKDLLDLLSISQGAYSELSAGGDPKAIRNASIIQRKLQRANAPPEMVEYCSKCKVSWDIWYRDKRHTLGEFDIAFLQTALNTIKNDWVLGSISFPALDDRITALWAAIKLKGLDRTLNKELLLGGVFSALVRSEAR